MLYLPEPNNYANSKMPLKAVVAIGPQILEHISSTQRKNSMKKGTPKNQRTIFIRPDRVQVDLFYLDLLGVSRAEMKDMLHRSDIAGIENVTAQDIEHMIMAEGIMYGIASMQVRPEPELEEPPF